MVFENHHVLQNVPAGGTSGFDLDAIGAINFVTVPTPAAFAPGILLLGAIMLRQRRVKRISIRRFRAPQVVAY